MEDNAMRDEILKIAMRFQIVSDLDFEGAVSISDVLKVLNNIYKSYQKFIEVEFFKNDNLKKAYQKNETYLKTIQKDLELLIVDLQYGSFETAVAPHFNTNGCELFTNDIKEWKQEKYSFYRDKIFTGNFEDINYQKEIEDYYTKEERAQIFNPLFNSIKEAKHYRVNIKNSDGVIQKALDLPDKFNFDFFTPEIYKPKEKDYRTCQVFMQIAKDDDNYDIKKGNIKKVLYIEELEHDTYPFKPDIIKYENLIYNLKQKLDCVVIYEDDSYIISNDLLEIRVWGDTREEAVDAFCFTFSALYQNFAKESDEMLTEKAKIIKSTLLNIVKGEYSDEN
jgi:hypothetical protein